MSQVSVRRVEGDSAASQAIIESLNGISDSIRSRAFELFESRGGANSYESGNANNDVSDWLQAERDLFSIPQAELTETDREIRIQVTVPGSDSKGLEVFAIGSTLIVRGTATESTPKMLFRRFDLSSTIDAGAVTAKLDNELLTITVAKSAGGEKSSAAKA